VLIVIPISCHFESSWIYLFLLFEILNESLYFCLKTLFYFYYEWNPFKLYMSSQEEPKRNYIYNLVDNPKIPRTWRDPEPNSQFPSVLLSVNFLVAMVTKNAADPEPTSLPTFFCRLI
jgi:hypothetical protein